MKRVLGSILLASILAFGASDVNSTQKDSNTTKVQEVPKFTLEDVNGNKIEIEQTDDGLKYNSLKDKNVILFFYLNDGAPCQGELKTFNEFVKDKKDIEIVTIELKGLDKEALKKYQQERNIEKFHNIVGKSAGDFVNYIAYRARWQGTVPFIIITDKKGAVKHIQIGAMNKAQLEDIYKKLNG